jgi:hypothetical protein
MSVMPFTGNEIPNKPSRDLITNNLTRRSQFLRYMQPDPEETQESDTLMALRRDMEQYLHSTDVDCVPCRESE